MTPKFYLKISSCFFLLAFAVPAFAQFSLSGNILHEDNRNPVQHVKISLPSLNLNTESDSAGHFEFHNLPSGYIGITLTHVGFQSEAREVWVGSYLKPIPPQEHVAQHMVNNSLVLDILLEPIPQAGLDEVLVSASRPTNNQTKTLAQDMVPIKEMDERGNLTVMEALATRPGIQMITTGPGIARPVIRGNSGNRIVTVMNGVKLENQQWDLEHTLGMNQFGIARVEVIKGPASFLYGSDAIGGVLNFVEENPADVNTHEAFLNTGFNSNTFGSNSGIGFKGASEKIYYSVYGGMNNHSDYYDGKNERVANSRFREYFAKGTIGIRHKQGLTQFSYQLNSGKYGIIEEEEDSAAEKEDHPMSFETPYHTLTHQTAILKHTHFIGNGKLVSSLSFQDDMRKELEPDDKESNPSLAMHLQTTAIDLRYDFNISSNNNLLIGTNDVYSMNSNSGYNRLIPDYNQKDFSLFAVNRYQSPDRRLHLDAGLRYDNRTYAGKSFGVKDSDGYIAEINNSFQNLSSSIGLNYLVSKQWAVYANAGNGYRAPNINELAANGERPETQRYEIGNAAFLKETNIEFDLGAHWQHRLLDLDIAVFSNKYQHYIYGSPTPDTIGEFPVYRYKQDNVTIMGGELKLDIHPPTWKGFVYSFSASGLDAKTEHGNYLPYMPPVKLLNEICYRRLKMGSMQNTFVRLGMQSVSAQNNVFTYELTTPSYTLVNLGFGGEIKAWGQRLMVNVGANNLLNQTYFDHLSRVRQFGLYNMGRSVYVNVKIPLRW